MASSGSVAAPEAAWEQLQQLRAEEAQRRVPAGGKAASKAAGASTLPPSRSAASLASSRSAASLAASDEDTVAKWGDTAEK